MATQRGKVVNEAGLDYYNNWKMVDAINAFQKAIKADNSNPEYNLNLARAYARSGDYDQAMRSLGQYLHNETKEDVAARYERLFSSALDDVETALIETSRKLGLTVAQTGKGIQMWLEYRITIGRRPLRILKPELWSAGVTYAIIKVNFLEIPRAKVAKAYKITERSLKEKYDELVETLDLMPADYRYFTGKENPLDKLVEAAQLLDQLDQDFQE